MESQFFYAILCLTLHSYLNKVRLLADDGLTGDHDAYQVLMKMLDGYDTRVRPNYTGKPTVVSLDYSILSFGHIEEADMVFPSDLFFRQRWNDYRLRHNMSRSLVLMTGTKNVPDIIWVPDTVFINSVDAKIHDVTVHNNKLDIEPNGNVFWGTRITVQGSCRLDLRSYPMDTQYCSTLVESYAYTDDHLQYKWHSHPGITLLDIEMPQFSLEGFQTREHIIPYTAGNYSVLNATFKIQRRVGNAILRIYVPTISIVCVSWVSLWIDKDSTSARTALCITTLLTISTIWGAINATFSGVSYIKAVDLFILVSFFFVFSTLVEYVIVLNVSARKKGIKRENSLASPRRDVPAKTTITDRSSKNYTFETSEIFMAKESGSHIHLRRKAACSTKEKERSTFSISKLQRPAISNIDKLARVALPLGYLMFNIYYWVTFLGSSKLKSFPR